MILSIAFKNILRNKRRTFLSGLTLFLVALFIILMMSIEYGTLGSIQENIVQHETGNVRIRNPLYTENERIAPLSLFVENTNEVVKKVESIEGVKYAELKIKTSAVVYYNEETEAASAVGIDFSTCNFFLKKDNVIEEGSLDSLKTLTKNPEVTKSKRPYRYAAVTTEFAKKYNLHENDKFTFMTKTASGGTNGTTAYVKAIIHFADSDYNNETFFLDINVLLNILRMNGNATEIMVVTNNIMDNKLSNKIADIVAKEFPYLEVKLWTKINGYYSMFEIADFMYFIFALVFFALAATVIFNSTMMSVMERKKEIGTLLSLGMEPSTVRFIFLLETIIISAIFTLAGCLLGAVFVQILKRTGINMSALGYDEMGGINYSTMLYPALSFGRYVEFFFTGFLTAVIACVIPSRMALKVQPAEALRTEN